MYSTCSVAARSIKLNILKTRPLENQRSYIDPIHKKCPYFQTYKLVHKC